MAQVELTGIVRRVVYRAKDGVYAVVRVDTIESTDIMTVEGPLANFEPGETVRLWGGWKEHPVFGKQFRADRAVAEVDRSEGAMVRYLSGLPGLGPETSRRIVTQLGAKAIEILEEEPWRVAQVKGIGKARAETAHQAAKARSALRQDLVFLEGLGLSATFFERLRQRYGNRVMETVRKNPYRLAIDISGIGFATADRIAGELGIPRQAPERVEAAVYFALLSALDEGHLFVLLPDLMQRTARLVEIEEGLVLTAVQSLHNDGLVLASEEQNGPVYLARWQRLEDSVARSVTDLLRTPRAQVKLAEEKKLLDLSPEQRSVLHEVARRGLVVVTGGPGTGKTTVTRALCDWWIKSGRQVQLCAPTGRAAKRIEEATGRPAQTIHRLLEWGRGEGGPARFGRNKLNPLTTDLVVVDEVSMLDIELFGALLEALSERSRLVLVGDVFQLPSIGPGQVLRDLIEAQVVPVVRLSQVFRQAQGSAIVANAYRVLQGELPVSEELGGGQPTGPETLAAGADFFVIRADAPDRVRDIVIELCTKRIPAAFGFDPMRDIQVLVPMHRGPTGTEEINRLLQAAFLPDAEAISGRKREFRVGDKVMQIRNNYDRDVFNGDVGWITAVRRTNQSKEWVVTAAFDGNEQRYREDELVQLEHAYAMSVHKSQGSEYPVVVIPLVTQHYLLLRRSVLYTAITRAKKLAVLVGSPKALGLAVREADDIRRNTQLAAKIAQQFGGAPGLRG